MGARASDQHRLCILLECDGRNMTQCPAGRCDAEWVRVPRGTHSAGQGQDSKERSAPTGGRTPRGKGKEAANAGVGIRPSRLV